jgi:hypothetical protein
MSAMTLPIEIVRQILQYSTPLELYHLGPVAGLTKNDLLNAITNDEVLLELLDHLYDVNDESLFDIIIMKKNHLLTRCPYTKNRPFAIRCLDMLADGLIQANQSIVEFIIKGAFIYDDVKSYVKIFRTVDVKLDHQCKKTQFTVDIGELGWWDWDSTCFNIKLYIAKKAFRLCPRQYYYLFLRIFSIHGKVEYVKLLLDNDYARYDILDYAYKGNRIWFINEVNHPEIKKMLLDVLEDSKNKKYVKTQEWWDSETDQEYYARTEIQLPFELD